LAIQLHETNQNAKLPRAPWSTSLVVPGQLFGVARWFA
jgi:hypothetical protein